VTTIYNGLAAPAGKYARIAAVGQGGMADVWLVVARGPAGFSKLLALKELRGELGSDPEFVSMFLAEAKLAAQLSHPHVVQTYEAEAEGGRLRIVMEWLEGQPLHALLGRAPGGRLPLAAHVFILTKVLAALEYAHDFCDYDGTPLNLVHRDISPQNVFVTYDGIVKLMDFGIAKIAGSEALTQAGVVKGKIGYVAPEQVMGDPVDRRADLFAVGVMLWEALVGRRLYAGEARHTIFAKRLQGDYEPVLGLAPGAPRELAAAVDRAMALSPDDRYPTASAMRADLEGWLAGQRASERELGALVAASFDEPRRRVRKLVEQQLRALLDERPGASSVPLVALVPAGEGGIGGGSLPPPERPTARTLPALAPPFDAGAGTLPMTQAMALGPAPLAAAPRRPRPWLRFGAAALALGALALAASWRRAAPEAVAGGPRLEARPALPLGGVAPGEPAEGASPSEVELDVRSQPPGARVYLDGRPLGQSPLAHRVARDDEAHSLRVTAPGFRDEERAIGLARDSAFDVVLKPYGRPARAAAKAPDEPPSPPPPPERLKQPSRDARPIVESNPY
jgi:hypothetical protein